MQKLLKSTKIFQSYDYNCTATFLWFTVYIALQCKVSADSYRNGDKYHRYVALEILCLLFLYNLINYNSNISCTN